MPMYEVEWSAKGTATVEADDAAEAEDILTGSVENFETVLLHAIDVDDVFITECQEHE